ncbi:hypothetical protein GUJ93_ZPchr0004g40455 [Zizania palustris]|uniref:Amine oxidase domain-containing protein n=1 Tax=Zizania palustris TaxID=103762 RepID=A0A8J5SHH0_ZIZPA|nr:hypothetical protein GUJ93_ZPchr0004g40455 [Zizania palustris]
MGGCKVSQVGDDTAPTSATSTLRLGAAEDDLVLGVAEVPHLDAAEGHLGLGMAEEPSERPVELTEEHVFTQMSKELSHSQWNTLSVSQEAKAKVDLLHQNLYLCWRTRERHRHFQRLPLLQLCLSRLQPLMTITMLMRVEFPIFHDQPRLPAPFGMLAYPEFPSLPLIDRLTLVPVMTAVIDFDNTDTAWKKYDSMSARELFKMSGCSQKLYKEVFEPAIQAALFAPGEQCSAAATLGMLYYYMLSHQENSDLLLCRGEVEDIIFSPWLKSLELKGLTFLGSTVPTSLAINKDTACVSGIVCGEEVHEADAFVLASGLSPLQCIIKNSPFLQSQQEFANLLHLSTIDVISIKLWYDKKITIPKAANVCSVVETEFYNASHLLPLNDEQIVSEASSHLIKCIQDFEGATVIQQMVRRSPKSTMHFLPGSYKYTLRGSTTLPNLFVAGDWIVNRHGSFSKEKAYVTGLEAANRVVDYLGDGDFAKIIAVEGDEPHIETARSINRSVNELKTQIPFSEFFLQ